MNFITEGFDFVRYEIRETPVAPSVHKQIFYPPQVPFSAGPSSLRKIEAEHLHAGDTPYIINRTLSTCPPRRKAHIESIFHCLDTPSRVHI